MSISIINGGSSGGGSANTGDITFSGVQIVGSGEDSGDGNGYGTIELVPDASRYAQDQYLVVDPTQPNHIHLRAGGTQDASNAELILGGEHAHVRVVDSGHEVFVRAASGGNQQTISLGAFRYNGGEAGAWQAIPNGSTFVYGDGVTYTVTGSAQDWESGNWAISLTPMPETEPTGDFDFSVPFDEKNFTFRSDGQLHTPGGVRFADDSVQTTAGVPYSGSWGSGYDQGSTVFQNTSITLSRNDNINGPAGLCKLSVENNAGGISGSAYGTLTLDASNPNDNSFLQQLTLSPITGITFGDGTTQSTAGVTSYNPHGANASSFGKVNNVMKISAAEYDVLTPDAGTVYIIVD